MRIENEAQLREIYGEPKGRASKKILAALDKHARNFISKSPFLVISTIDDKGKMDASPRGGQPGFVKVINDHEIVIPDFKGNNLVDSLINISKTGRVGLLFMIPGIDETLRVNGGAMITNDDEALDLCTENGKRPITCLKVDIEEVFLHCAKAFMRSRLWDPEAQINPEDFPSMGQMLKDHLKSTEEPESREDMIRRYMKDL
jgi:PPOX class probable FMN-dependent enzyme